MRHFNASAAVAAALVLAGAYSIGPAQAQLCTFTTVGTTMFLVGDCTTDTTIVVPDGFTLNGQGHAITAVEPVSGPFAGGVIENDGATAHVTRLVVNTDSLAVCGAGDARLRGIMFDDASGSITHNTVQNINRGASGCQEGNAIEVRNEPFDGTHPNTQSVEIAHNVLETWQKTGIVCNGDVVCDIHYNFVGESATQENLAANSIQIGFGGSGTVRFNHIAGNQWMGTSCFVATAVLLFDSYASTVSNNNIGGNSEVGIYAIADNHFVDNNRVFDGGPDTLAHTCDDPTTPVIETAQFDIGICDDGDGNAITNN